MNYAPPTPERLEQLRAAEAFIDQVVANGVTSLPAVRKLLSAVIACCELRLMVGERDMDYFAGVAEQFLERGR